MRILLFALFTLLSQAGIAQTAGPVAHWDFNGTTLDSTGNGHNGIAHNISYIHTPGGTATDSSAIFMGSTNSYISIAHDTMLNMEKHTLAASLRIDEFYTGPCQLNFVFMKGTPHYSGTWGLAYFDNAYDSSCIVTNDTNNFVLYGEAGTNNISIPQGHWQTTNTLRTSTWYCVVSTWDGQERKTYINGNLVSTAFPSQSPVAIGTNNDSLIIGCNRKGNFQAYPNRFKGAINDIKIYDRVLTSNEISCFLPATDTPDTTDTTTSLTHQVLQDRDVVIYPVPANSNVTIETGAHHISGRIAVYNSVGVKLIEEQHNDTKTNINVSDLAPGIYLITITAPDGHNVSRKLLIE